MVVSVGKELAAIEAMSVSELREKYAEVFGDAMTAGNRDWLRKQIAWRIQALSDAPATRSQRLGGKGKWGGGVPVAWLLRGRGDWEPGNE